MPELNLIAILTLALADAINPCELAVLTLALIAILTRYPKEKKKVLQVGFSFTIAIFLMYFIYGLILINFFKAITELSLIKIWLYRILGVIGIVIGLSNIKDFFVYGGAGFVTEAPRKWRPGMKNLISKITSPKGAFIIGIIAALFLTPCTIGPYIIAGGMLSPIALLNAIPWLLIYNIIFVLPMIAITLIIYFGFTSIDKISGWREKNIRIMHLITGILLILISITLLTGWLY